MAEKKCEAKISCEIIRNRGSDKPSPKIALPLSTCQKINKTSRTAVEGQRKRIATTSTPEDYAKQQCHVIVTRSTNSKCQKFTLNPKKTRRIEVKCFSYCSHVTYDDRHSAIHCLVYGSIKSKLIINKMNAAHTQWHTQQMSTPSHDAIASFIWLERQSLNLMEVFKQQWFAKYKQSHCQWCLLTFFFSSSAS